MMAHNHKHILIAGNCRTPIPSVEVGEKWLRDIVDAVGMKVMMGPYVQYCDTEGNEGHTGIVVIETSHCSFHIFEIGPEPYFRFDLYSCRDFDTLKVVEMMDILSPEYIHYKVIDRNNSRHQTTVDVDIVPLV